MATPGLIQRTVSNLVAAGLAAISLVVHAQSSPSNPGADWRSANEAVGQFRRGHADVLKWEQANMTAENEPAPGSPDLLLMTSQEAVRLAWRNHRELAMPLAVLGSDIVERIADGRWTEIDAGLLRRIHDTDQLLDVAAAARKAWLQAISARMVLKHQRDAVIAAEASSELAQRMANVGNWSNLQQAQVQSRLKVAQIDSSRAGFVAVQAQAALLDFLQLGGTHAAVGLPDTLPEVPAQIMADAYLRRRLAEAVDTLPRADSTRTKALAALAFGAYQASHDIALRSQEILKLQEFITEETVLHYNGMLKSVWDVLGEARSRSQMAIDAIGAQRDFWIAETDLQLVLQGGVPASFVSLARGSSEGSAVAGH